MRNATYPATPLGSARRLRDSMGEVLGRYGHRMTWRRRSGKPEFAGTCSRCRGKIIAGVDREGYDFLRYPPPEILRTRFLRSLDHCLGRP